ncbi:hypothetical protein [Streptomyces sp. NPDC052107]|uniref:hypothetical protein n=1 Tax=Streptomyces sp. NPDC052107 TaxID=3155632 RepID=UPI00341E174D
MDAVIARMPLPHRPVARDDPLRRAPHAAGPTDHRLAGKEYVTLDDIADERTPRLPDPAWS